MCSYPPGTAVQRAAGTTRYHWTEIVDIPLWIGTSLFTAVLLWKGVYSASGLPYRDKLHWFCCIMSDTFI